MSSKNRGVAVVTGASSGIGAEFARQLAARGFDLVLVARRKDRLDAIAEEVSSANDVQTEVIEADLSKKAGVASVAERLKQDDITMLVNNAGFGTAGDFAELPIGREMEEIDLNIGALTKLSHAALGRMIAKKHGTIINVGSVGAFQPVPHMASYAATKAYVLSFTEALHEEAKPHGVNVTCLCPGVVMTEFQQVAKVDAEKMPSIGVMTADKVVLAALRGAARGRAIVVPGPTNQAAVGLAKFAPRFLIRKVSGSMFKDVGA
ncbi:MAG: SDR family oxidoreductase [Chloroflexi bacterium]|nr:SDR family oxidoreductase [Chloroflexota bacterium]